MSELQGNIRRLLSAPITPIDPPDSHSDRNHTQNFIAEAVDAEKQLWKLIHLKGLLHIDVQVLYHKARSCYEKIILNDHELAELQDIEYSLWKLHYKHIDEYRNRIRQNSVIKEGKNLEIEQDVVAMQRSDDYVVGLKFFLSDATEFYHYLIKKIRRSYGIQEELLFSIESEISSSVDSVTPDRCQFSCHRCLVCLGDLARYREVYGTSDGETQGWSVAATHYLNALNIWPDNGNPHNQLAVLAIYVGDELLALYHCIRSLAIKEPFPNAWDNLILLLEKNRSSQLVSLVNKDTFNFFKPSERSSLQIREQSSDSFSTVQSRESNGDTLTEQMELWTLFVRTISYFYVKTSLEDFPCIFGSTIKELEAFLSLDDRKLSTALESYQCMEVARKGPFRILHLVSVLIFTIDTLSDSSKLQKEKHTEHMQQPFLVQQAFTMAFVFMGRLVNRCIIADPVDSSPLLPAILVFVEWLVEVLDRAEECMTDDKCACGASYFHYAFVDLLNLFGDERIKTETPEFHNLWEDNELRGFLPISQFRRPSYLKTTQEASYGFKYANDCEVRISRIFIAAKKIVNKSTGSQKWIFHDQTRRKFYTKNSKELPRRGASVAGEGGLDLKVRELQQQKSILKDVLPLQEAIKACEVTPSEEEEVILFKPITRYDSAPLYLPQLTSSQVPKGDGLNLEALSCQESSNGLTLHIPKVERITSHSSTTFWHEPIPEDSVLESFTEPTDSPRFKALSARSDELPSLAGPPSLNAWVINQDKKEPNENIASTYLSELSSAGLEVIQEDSSATPYMPPVPSAPLLPEDAAWFNGDSSNYAYPKDFLSEATKAQALPYFDPSSSHAYTPYADQANSSQWVQQSQVNLDQLRHSFSPLQPYTPTFGRFWDHDARRMAFHPSPYPGFGERSFPAYTGPSPYGYSGVRDLRSEQQLLLKYLKEKERHLQQEAQLRGSA